MFHPGIQTTSSEPGHIRTLSSGTVSQFLLPVGCLHSQISYVLTRSKVEERSGSIKKLEDEKEVEQGCWKAHTLQESASALTRGKMSEQTSCSHQWGLSAPRWSPLKRVSNHPRLPACLWSRWNQLFLLSRTQGFVTGASLLHYFIITAS